MNEFLLYIMELHHQRDVLGELGSDEDNSEWNFIERNFLYDDKNRHIPIPVYSYIKPTMGPIFLLHIMLSLG